MKVNTLEDIIRPLQAKRQFFCDTFGVLKMGIFGSFVYGTQTETSGTDIVIEMKKRKPYNIMVLMGFLGKDLGRFVDLRFEI